MTIEEQRLKTSLHEAICKWSEQQNSKVKSDYDTTGIYVHPDFESDMTDAAWAVFSAMFKSQAYKASQE